MSGPRSAIRRSRRGRAIAELVSYSPEWVNKRVALAGYRGYLAGTTVTAKACEIVHTDDVSRERSPLRRFSPLVSPFRSLAECYGEFGEDHELEANAVPVRHGNLRRVWRCKSSMKPRTAQKRSTIAKATPAPKTMSRSRMMVGIRQTDVIR